MAERPETSGAAAILGEVVAAAPDAQKRDRVHQPCGTTAGARWHQRRGQEPCPPCRESLRTYNRDYARLARQNAAWRARAAANKKRWDAGHREQLNAARRRLRRQRCATNGPLTDWVVVLRLVGGEAVPYNRAERLEAVRQLRDCGTPYRVMAERLNVTDRQIHRDLAALGLTNPAGAVA